MMCRFTKCNTRPTLVGDVNNEGGCAYVGAGGIWRISVPSKFSVNLKLFLKKNSLKNKLNQEIFSIGRDRSGDTATDM